MDRINWLLPHDVMGYVILKTLLSSPPLYSELVLREEHLLTCYRYITFHVTSPPSSQGFETKSAKIAEQAGKKIFSEIGEAGKKN